MRGAVYLDSLPFELYQNTERTVVFPEDDSGPYEYAPNGSAIVKTVYGRIPAFQDVSVDNYSRLLIAIIEY